MAGPIKHLDQIIEGQQELEEEGFVPKRRRDDDEMDITPMIDITFLLLIFFLVTSTPDSTTAVDLPKAENGSPVSQISSTIFTVGEGDLDSAPVYEADGKVESARLSDDPDERKKQIKEAVERGLQDEAKKDVLIKADKNVKCREIDRVMKAISKVDGVRLHLGILTPN
ncbi:MAG: biopolymer transporter ExbD [Planctomycetota bacterium]